MAAAQLSLWLEALADESESAAERADGPIDATLELLDARRRPLGKPISIARPKSAWVEVPSGEAGFEWSEAYEPLSLALDELPEEAAFVRAHMAGARVVEVPLAAALAARAQAPADRRVFNAGGDWTLLLVSERFDRADAFFDACDQLHRFILGQPPFSDPRVGAHLRLEALFWPSDSSGLFNTRVDGRLVFGDNQLVRRFIKKSRAKGKMAVVLVNIPVRGGAGGSSDRPTWVTITSAPGERWEAVALHEMGHAFGLADEYDDAAQPTREPRRLEPNVTARRRGAEAPWASRCTPGIVHDPTSDFQGRPAVPPGTIGTFEGARYKLRDRYRPTATCLMRTTNQPFCPICQAVIEEELG